jgi:cysteine/glycine-rich protein
MSGKFGGGGVKCAICGKTAYNAEQISFEKVIYHVNCFRCTVCNKKMGSDKAVMHEGKLYDRRCYARQGFANQVAKVVWTKKTGTAKSSGGSSKFGGGGNPCTICGKTVYTAEQTVYDKKIYHPKCFCCSKCNKSLSPTNANMFEENLFCLKCWAEGNYTQKQTHSTKWKASSAPKKQTITTSSKGGSGRFGGGGVPCTICGKTVYRGELLSFEKKPYHAKCFKCCYCKLKIRGTADAQQFEDLKTKETSIWCKKCFKDQGKAREQTNSAKTWKATTSSGGGSSKFGGGGVKCVICNKTVYQAEQILYEKMVYHAQCFKCSDCGRKIEPSNANLYKKQVKCKKCWTEKRYAAKQTADANNSETKKNNNSNRFSLQKFWRWRLDL